MTCCNFFWGVVVMLSSKNSKQERSKVGNEDNGGVDMFL